MSDYDFGATIRRLRTEHTLTQAELGKVVGVSMQAISKWERGSLPDIGILLTLADYFHVSLDELMGRQGASSPDSQNYIYNTILQAPTKDTFSIAAKGIWAAIKGVSKIPGVDNIGFSDSSGLNNSRVRIANNYGVGYGLASQNIQAFAIMPEPEAGFRSIAADPAAYAELFHLLGDLDTMELFLFIGARSNTLFTADLAEKETGISLPRVKQILSTFITHNWCIAESADIVDGRMTLYRSALREDYLFFLLYAREIMQSPRFWYLSSSTKRTKPLLSNDSASQK